MASIYRDYFRIDEDPFSITPDPKFLFLSRNHREALAHLRFGMEEGGGFVLLTGGVGTGKTLLCRNLLESLPDEVDVALILNPRLQPFELVASICDELHVEYPDAAESIKVLVDHLNSYLLSSHAVGRRTVVIIDEAQNLSYEALEQVRLLTNLETKTEKLMQIFLIGQSELKEILDQPNLRQLTQRITARYHLESMGRPETKEYIRHRLEVVGISQHLFTNSALEAVYQLTKGIPRRINIFCERAMVAAYAERKNEVDYFLLKRAAEEVEGNRRKGRWRSLLTVSAVAAVLVVLSTTLSLNDITGFGNNVEHQMRLLLADLAVHKKDAPVTPKETVTATTIPNNKVDFSPIRIAHAGYSDSELAVPEKEEHPLIDGKSFEAMTAGEAFSEDRAFSALLRYWNVDISAVVDGSVFCKTADAHKLKCVYGKGTWTSLEYFNRPVIIELETSDGRFVNMMVTKFHGNRVVIEHNGERMQLERDTIDHLWSGSYVLLWKPPQLNETVLAVGARGQDVIWLNDILDRDEGIYGIQTQGKRNDRFDQTLVERVVRFQQKHGLTPDGIVGEQTLIQLQSASGDPDVPLLMQSKG
ncbi:MAG: AAA family ATPase [gamma proteobacterium endosymbiont of Lamellibrachia anaximandri]|nr:AAA family ATPase [gamma proteobacterium endosymbiont of Lamellibrachia anaximandri]